MKRALSHCCYIGMHVRHWRAAGTHESSASTNVPVPEPTGLGPEPEGVEAETTAPSIDPAQIPDSRGNRRHNPETARGHDGTRRPPLACSAAMSAGVRSVE